MIGPGGGKSNIFPSNSHIFLPKYPRIGPLRTDSKLVDKRVQSLFTQCIVLDIAFVFHSTSDGSGPNRRPAVMIREGSIE